MGGRDENGWLPRWIHRLPADIVAVVLLVILTDIVVLAPILDETPFRVVLGLPLALFLPGYAIVAALFPERGGPVVEGDEEETEDTSIDPPRTDAGIDSIERLALSFGLSIATVPLFGLVLNFTPWGIRLVPILVSLSGLTLVAAAVATKRRWSLPSDDQFQVPYREWLVRSRLELVEPESRVDLALNVVVVLALLLVAASVGYAVAYPQPGEAFTEFYLLTENEEGELVAGNYPTEFVVGESRPLIVGIRNHERRTLDYWVVVKLQQVEFEGNDTRVTAEVELDRLEAEVSSNETWHEEYDVQPTIRGQRLRLAFLLYVDSVPGDPTVENAYRETHLWINVSE